MFLEQRTQLVYVDLLHKSFLLSFSFVMSARSTRSAPHQVEKNSLGSVAAAAPVDPPFPSSEVRDASRLRSQGPLPLSPNALPFASGFPRHGVVLAPALVPQVSDSLRLRPFLLLQQLSTLHRHLPRSAHAPARLPSVFSRPKQHPSYQPCSASRLAPGSFVPAVADLSPISSQVPQFLPPKILGLVMWPWCCSAFWWSSCALDYSLSQHLNS